MLFSMVLNWRGKRKRKEQVMITVVILVLGLTLFSSCSDISSDDLLLDEVAFSCSCRMSSSFFCLSRSFCWIFSIWAKAAADHPVVSSEGAVTKTHSELRPGGCVLKREAVVLASSPRQP